LHSDCQQIHAQLRERSAAVVGYPYFRVDTTPLIPHTWRQVVKLDGVVSPFVWQVGQREGVTDG
jgi:hypothetical protein